MMLLIEQSKGFSFFYSSRLQLKMTVELTKPRYADPSFSYPPDTPVIPLDAKEAFNKLTFRF